MKEQIKTPEQKLSDREIASLSDAEFKTFVIRMLTDIIALQPQNTGRNEDYTK